MDINGGFFSDTKADALREMQRLAGCEVRQCVYPAAKRITYYISERGHLFGVQHIHGKLLTIVKQPASNSSHGKRSDGGITHRLHNGRKGRESLIAAELLVYCTFCINRWEPDLKIDFRNGLASDIRPDNLMEHHEEIPPQWAERLTDNVDIYRANFKSVVNSVRWWVSISEEDAKDVTQDTFIWLCTTGFRSATVHLPGLWKFWARHRAIDFRRHTQYLDTENYDTILDLQGRHDCPIEMDLFHLQKGEKRSTYLQLWAQGCTPTDIAEMTGSSVSAASSSVTHSIRFLRQFLRHEKELLRP